MINPAYANHACPEKFLSLFFISDDDVENPAIVSFWWQEIQSSDGAAAFLHESAQEIQTTMLEQEQQKHDTEAFWEENIQRSVTKLADIAADVAHRYGLGLGERVDMVYSLPMAHEFELAWWSVDVRIPCVRIPLLTPDHVHQINRWIDNSDVVDDTMLAMSLQDNALCIGGYQYNDVYSFRHYAQDLERAVRDARVQCQAA